MARFDWYQATIHDIEVGELVGQFLTDFPDTSVARCAPRHGYREGLQILRGSHELAQVWHGGNPGVHVQATSEDAPLVAEFLRSNWPWHHVTRADACEDWTEPGLFDVLARRLIAYAQEKGITINQQGDWVRGKGRTLYLGSPKSATRLRLYEKGYERLAAGWVSPNLDWIRLEVMVRPKHHARRTVAEWQPAQCFAASKWLAGAMKAMGWDHLQAASVGTVREETTVRRQRLHLVKQYGRILEEWAREAGGWHEIGYALEELLHEVRSATPAERQSRWQAPAGAARSEARTRAGAYLD